MKIDPSIKYVLYRVVISEILQFYPFLGLLERCNGFVHKWIGKHGNFCYKLLSRFFGPIC